MPHHRSATGMWNRLMHLEHGWLARHPNATVAIVLALVIVSPGVVEWML